MACRSMKLRIALYTPSRRAGDVGAAVARRDHVDVGLRHHLALGRPGDRPQRAFAFGEAVRLRLRGDVALAEEGLGHRLQAGHCGGEIAFDAFGEVPFALLDLAVLLHPEREAHPGQQHRLGAQQRRDVGDDDLGRIEILGIGPEADARAGLARRCGADFLQRLFHLAVVGEHQPVARAVAPDLDFEPGRERVGDADAHAVQAAGNAIGGVRIGLPELAARMQRGEYHLHRRDFLFRMDVDRDAAAVVGDFGRTVFVQHHGDVLGEAGQALVRGIVDHLHQRVIRVGGVGVHPRPVQDRRQILQDLDVFGVVSPRFCCHKALGYYLWVSVLTGNHTPVGPRLYIRGRQTWWKQVKSRIQR